MKISIQRPAGFTLIELVMVIVILGILASFAVPRFADITTDARRATVDAVGGSLRSAAALAHATSLAQSRTQGQSISMEGATITMSNFYPSSSGSITGGIVAAMFDTTGFTVTQSITTDTLLFSRNGAATGACYAAYQAAATGTTPTISVLTTGC